MGTRRDAWAALLRECGCKVTPGRVAILAALAQRRVPQSTTDICATLAGVVDRVTVYRTLAALADAGLVRKVDLQHAHMHYELVAGRQHHHHLLCKTCGMIEDIDLGDAETLERKALTRARSFASVSDHALEFFGTCKRCARAAR